MVNSISADQFFFGKFFYTPNAGELTVLEDALIAVDAEGVICSVQQPGDPGYAENLDTARRSPHFFNQSPDQFILPGMVDLHIHAPQWPQLGKALHLPLQDWLQNCTFPLEARYSDAAFAFEVYSSLVKTLLANGTTSAVYFASIHQRATEILAEICLQQGQRAWVGKVAMDDPAQCPEYYRDASTYIGLKESEQLIQFVRALDGNARSRIQPILTPRFIPSCTDAMLKGLGEMAEQYNCPVQTHCSESDWEHQFVIDRLGKSDAEALRDFGLLRRETVLAHSNFISHSDMDVIARCQSGIAHCPLSNMYFADSVFPLRAALEKGLHVGLGTDIAGGPSASLFDNCRAAIGSSRLLESGTNASIARSQRGVTDARADFLEAYYLATAGGGVVMNQRIGKFETGYRFDALLIDFQAEQGTIEYFPALDSDEDLFQKTLYAVTPANITTVWVDGKEVRSNSS